MQPPAGLSAARHYTEFGDLLTLRHGNDQDPERMREVAEQFESLFIQMVMRSMRESTRALTGGESLLGSRETETYEDMLDSQLGLALGGRIGLAPMILRSMEGRQAGIEPRGREASILPPRRTDLPLPSASPAGAPGPGAVLAPGSALEPADSRAFVAALLPQAKSAAARLGVDPQLLVAQAALETGWGRHLVQGADGASSHNLFNIKADHRWNGPSATVEALEYRDGVPLRERAQFRVYGSFADSFADYAEFLQQDRYHAAVAAADSPGRYMRGLQQAGYATDPEYADKVLSVYSRIRGDASLAMAATHPTHLRGD